MVLLSKDCTDGVIISYLHLTRPYRGSHYLAQQCHAYDNAGEEVFHHISAHLTSVSAEIRLCQDHSSHTVDARKVILVAVRNDCPITLSRPLTGKNSVLVAVGVERGRYAADDVFTDLLAWPISRP